MAGGVVIAPTESSYGIFASVRIPEACARVRALKDRDAALPLPLVVSGAAGLNEVARSCNEFEEKLIAHFWPGPLTLVLPAQPGLPEAVVGKDGTVGVRMSPHPVVSALCAAVGPLTCTSANLSGEPAAFAAHEIHLKLFSEDVLVVDDGPSSGSLPSTVAQVESASLFRVIREGPVTRAQIEAVLGF